MEGTTRKPSLLLAVVASMLATSIGCAGRADPSPTPAIEGIAIEGIAIVAPSDGATIPAGRTVIQVAAPGVGEEALHWHLYVDGELQGMISGLETGLELEPGPHALRAVLSSTSEHEEHAGAPESTIHVTVTE